MKSIQVCVNRFDDETKQSFLELYDKVDADVDLEDAENKMYEDEGTAEISQAGRSVIV